SVGRALLPCCWSLPALRCSLWCSVHGRSEDLNRQCACLLVRSLGLARPPAGYWRSRRNPGPSGSRMMVRNQLAQVPRDPSASATRPSRASIEAPNFEEEFGQFLVAGGVIDSLVLERARSAAGKSGERLDRVLTKLGLVPEENLA